MRLTLTQIRVSMLILNLALTLMIGGQTFYGVFNQEKPPVRLLPIPPEAELSYRGERVGSGPGATVQMKGLGQSLLVPRVEVVAPPPKGPDEGPKPPPPTGPDELPPGPLNDTWEFVSVIYIPLDPGATRATLQKKDASGVTGVPGMKKPVTRTPPKVIRSTPPARVRTPAPGGVVPVATDKKTLRPTDHWVDEDAKINIWVIEVTPDRFIYEDSTQPGRTFALARKTTSIYQKGTNGESRLNKVETETDLANPEEKPESHFFPVEPDRERTFRERKSVPAGAAVLTTGGKSLPPNAAHPSQAGGRPLSQEEQMKKLQDTMSTLKNNKDFQKAPKADREKLQQLLGGKK
jgi:hypothetical protein